jgi:hypothetical protein
VSDPARANVAVPPQVATVKNSPWLESNPVESADGSVIVGVPPVTMIMRSSREIVWFPLVEVVD